MKKNSNKNCTQPRKNDSVPWNVTPVMTARTYSDRLEAEFREELAAITMAETFPQMLNYRPEEKENSQDEEE